MMGVRSGPGVIASVAAAVTLTLGFCTTSSREAARPGDSPSARPSVLLVTLDTVRADHLGCYGDSQIETPALDRLAAEGLRFQHAYAQAPITLPSHAVILTGTYPLFNGVRDFTSRGLPGSIPTVAEIFRRNGYRTAAFVSSFVLNRMWGLNRGFDVYDDNLAAAVASDRSPFQLERRGDRTVARLLDWLDRPNAKDPRPFFVWLHLYDPHSPYRPPEPYRRRYASHPYDGEIAFDDNQFGRLIARLRSLNLYDRTLIAVLSDHGESLGEHGESEHGFFVYNATLRVPLILKLPGKTLQGRVISEPVGTVDVAPTLAQACGIAAEETRSFQGRSLLQAGDRSRAPEDNVVYAESYYPRNSFGWHALRSLITSQYQYIDAPRTELYDLKRDPGERTNSVAGNSAAAALGDRLDKLERKYGGGRQTAAAAPLDPETLEKLKSLGYLSYRAGSSSPIEDAQRPDPKDKITVLNRILRAADLVQLSRRAEADELLLQVEKEEPGLYVIPFQRGENHLAWGKPQLALAEFGQTLARNPTFDQAALGLGRAHFALGQDERAATAFELALRLNPRNFLASVALAKVYWRQNLIEKAEAQLAPVVEAHPELAEAHTDYGIILVKLKKYREALPEIERGIKLGYHDAIAFNYLGIARAERGDRGRAIRAYQRAVELNPKYAAAYLNLALEYRRQGQGAKAQSSFEKVCKLSDELCRQYASQFSSSPAAIQQK